MRIGLVGGIGPAATITYYRTLVDHFADRGRRLDLTIVNADAAEMTANMAAGRARPQAEIFAGHIDRLKAGGCGIAALTSMGGHFCIDQLAPISALPLVTAGPALEAYFSGSGLARIGVLGTRTVMQNGLYGLSSVEVVAPAGRELDEVHDAYVALAVAGRATAAQGALFARAGMRLHRDRGAEIVALGGTDLSLAFEDGPPAFPIVDTAVIHATAIARAAIGG